MNVFSMLTVLSTYLFVIFETSVSFGLSSSRLLLEDSGLFDSCAPDFAGCPANCQHFTFGGNYHPNNIQCDCSASGTTNPGGEMEFCKQGLCHVNGCSQCKDGYFKRDYASPCVSCNDVFGDGCQSCQDFNGCSQCKQGYERVLIPQGQCSYQADFGYCRPIGDCTNDPPTPETTDSNNDYIIDGDHWHTIFYRFTNESGINAANNWCYDLKDYTLSSDIITSVHCGVQNSIEQVSFGAHGVKQLPSNRSLEYGFAFTFSDKSMKLLFTNNNNNGIYSLFRNNMDLYRDYDSFGEQDYQGIWIFDWTHGDTPYTNIRSHYPLSLNRVKKNSTFHFVYFKFKYDNYTYTVTPTLIDNYRDLKNTMVSPYDLVTLIVSQFSFGIQCSNELLSFDKHSIDNNAIIDRSTEYGFVNTYDNFDLKEFMVGANHTDRPVYNLHHDVFKNMIGNLHNFSGAADAFFALDGQDVDGVFVFDFTDEIQV